MSSRPTCLARYLAHVIYAHTVLFLCGARIVGSDMSSVHHKKWTPARIYHCGTVYFSLATRKPETAGLPSCAALAVQNMSLHVYRDCKLQSILMFLQKTILWLHSCCIYSTYAEKLRNCQIHQHEGDMRKTLWDWFGRQSECCNWSSTSMHIPEFLAWTASCDDDDRVASLGWHGLTSTDFRNSSLGHCPIPYFCIWPKELILVQKWAIASLWRLAHGHGGSVISQQIILLWLLILLAHGWWALFTWKLWASGIHLRSVKMQMTFQNC